VIDGPPESSCKLTSEVQARIFQAVAKGASYQMCADSGGITRKTLHNWLRRGQIECEEQEEGTREETTHYGVFYRAFKAFEAQLGLDMLDTITGAAKKGPQYWAAAMTLLARRFPQDFGERMTGSEGPKTVEFVVQFRNDWRSIGGDEGEILDVHLLPEQPSDTPQLAIPPPGAVPSTPASETV
jgi:hypothetical protein